MKWHEKLFCHSSSRRLQSAVQLSCISHHWCKERYQCFAFVCIAQNWKCQVAVWNRRINASTCLASCLKTDKFVMMNWRNIDKKIKFKDVDSIIVSAFLQHFKSLVANAFLVLFCEVYQSHRVIYCQQVVYCCSTAYIHGHFLGVMWCRFFSNN